MCVHLMRLSALSAWRQEAERQGTSFMVVHRVTVELKYCQIDTHIHTYLHDAASFIVFVGLFLTDVKF